MPLENQPTTEIASVTPIRVETALSRYPVHRLAKHGDIIIDIREMSENGEALIRWEVSHNSKYGQPGPLAYKLDTLVINRRIEEAARPIPRIIKLGSLHDICKELGQSEGENKNTIKRALYQNAGAFITAKTRYRQSSGTERSIEFGDTRYGVVFTGEKLPDGRTADAVYIVLHDFYREILDNAITRPLDYGYLKSLTPAPQRFYELLSYQMYAALKHDRARAKLIYSEFCTHAPQTRYLEFDGVKKQMHKIHRVHRKSGYIAKIDYEQTTDGDGRPDWVMLYMPGVKAHAEYRVFTKRVATGTLAIEPLPAKSTLDAPEPTQFDLELLLRRRARSKAKPPESSPLATELAGYGITPAIAVELVRDRDAEEVRSQIEILEWMQEKKPGKIADPAAWLVSAIKTGHAAPRGFVSKAERQRREEAKQARDRQAAEDRRRKQEADAEERRQKELVSGYWNGLSKEQQAEHDAAAIAQADGEERKLIEAGPMKRIGMTMLRDSYTRKLLQAEGKLPPVEA
jgi:hypothetical protein